MADGMHAADVTIVIITFNRCDEAMDAVGRACRLGEAHRVIVVDNASTDGTAQAIRRAHPAAGVIRLGENIGAAARNVGVAVAHTPFVALCDDDTWWSAGSLCAAQSILENHPEVVLLCARVIVEPRGVEDPTSLEMARGAGGAEGLPGVPVLGFLAGASVVRRSAFMAMHGFDARYFIGGEEAPLALDFLARGWRMLYAPQLEVHHAPSRSRDQVGRSRLQLRNAVYTAVLRLPPAAVFEEGIASLRAAGCLRAVLWIVREVIVALPWLLHERKVVPEDVVAARRRIRRVAARRR